jgi:hypothetical protein
MCVRIIIRPKNIFTEVNFMLLERLRQQKNNVFSSLAVMVQNHGAAIGRLDGKEI